MGGSGGDDFTAQAAQAEAKRQAARDALNLQFGIAPTNKAMPTRDQFTTAPAYSGSSNHYEDFGTPGGYEITPGSFNQAGYDAAVAAANGSNAEAAKNKAAREALYQRVRGDAFTAGARKLDESRDSAARNLKFALFGQGLNGGSEDVNQHALLDRTYNQGKLDLGAKADAAATELRSGDEQTRLGLLQSINAGMDQGSALSSSLNQMKVNSDRAAAAAQGTSLGDLFADAGLLYSNSQAGKGVADARSAFSTLTGNSGAPRKGNTTGIVSWGG